MEKELVNEIMNDILSKNEGNYNTLVTFTYANGHTIQEPYINFQLEDDYVYATDHMTYGSYITYKSIEAICAVRANKG